MSSPFAESVLGDAVLEWFGALGYEVAHGPHIAPGEPAAERTDFREPILRGRLVTAWLMSELNRPLYPGPFGAEFTMPPFDRDLEEVEAMTRPLEVAPSEFTLTDPEEAALRIGLGRVDMEFRWMASLDDGDTLRLWRSWTGHEIYRATFERRAGILTQSGLHVESAPEAHRVNAKDRHAQQFVETLRHCLALITPARG